LEKLLMSTDQTKELVLSGVQPSGAQVHIGNYLGAMKRFVTLSQQYPTIFCLVDMHALTSVSSKDDLRQYSMSLAAAYFSIGLDPAKTIIFRQSDVPQVTELAWYLSCQFPLGLLERAHALKDARAKDKVVNSGLMFYPILMAADILLYKATKIPVGADQKQHLEMTRDVAIKFNAAYGDIFPVPEPLIEADTGVIPGLDGRKMSKSYNNYIGLFEDPKAVRKKVMRIVTDSKSEADKKDPDTCNVFSLYKYFATKPEIEALRDKYLSGGMGYGVAKQELFEVIERELSPLRERYNAWITKEDDIWDLLRSGASRAQAIARTTISEVREVQGLGLML
jgi:tryptophanyl-tRNA synthetase